MGPSKMAKLGVAALAATAAMGQGAGHGISPSRGTAAAVNHFKQVECKDFHITDMVPHSEDHGMPTEHYRPVLEAAMEKKRYCRRTRQPMRNPNTGKPMSKKKQKQANRRRRAQERQEQERKNQQEIEREAMEEMRREQQRQRQQRQQQQQQGETSGSTDTGVPYAATMRNAAGMTAAAAYYYMRKKKRDEAKRKGEQKEEGETKSSVQINNPEPLNQDLPLSPQKLQDEPTKKKKTAYRTLKSKFSKITGLRRKKTRKNRLS